eukprot:gnl/TRDRNA2_/TRDRNA2_170570_c7_seq2.p1 gnl/TRDRNA2_/TRDRNA2_170570_c7~~gnl/TRDRNA2_/TRDRNA2_170570_c7_seq2.p1  ORF type:complete len:811 (-),score=122.03 gnl/TRDRNA2_/TRDRNA2_170570_c7_seq2:17-2203(-)
MIGIATKTDRRSDLTVSKKKTKDPNYYVDFHTGRTINLLLSDNAIGRLAAHPYTEFVTLSVIFINALWLGLDTDFNKPGSAITSELPRFFEVGELVFAAFFNAEIVLRVLAYKEKINFVKDPHLRFWNWFDGLLVFVMDAELFLLYCFGIDLSSIRQLRMARLMRMSKMVRALRMIPELAHMVKSVLASIKGASAAMILAASIMFIFAIIFTIWGRGLPPDEEQYGEMGLSMLTLLQVLCFDGPFEILMPLIRKDAMMASLMVCYIGISSITAMNMLIGVICEVMLHVAQVEKEKMVIEKVEQLFEHMDTEERDGYVNRSEWNASCHHLAALGIEAEVLTTLFDIIDFNGDGEISPEEMSHAIVKITSPPTSQDLLTLLNKIHRVHSKMTEAKEAGLLVHVSSEAILNGSQQASKSDVAEANPLQPICKPIVEQEVMEASGLDPIVLTSEDAAVGDIISAPKSEKDALESLRKALEQDRASIEEDRAEVRRDREKLATEMEESRKIREKLDADMKAFVQMVQDSHLAVSDWTTSTPDNHALSSRESTLDLAKYAPCTTDHAVATDGSRVRFTATKIDVMIESVEVKETAPAEAAATQAARLAPPPVDAPSAPNALADTEPMVQTRSVSLPPRSATQAMPAVQPRAMSSPRSESQPPTPPVRPPRPDIQPRQESRTRSTRSQLRTDSRETAGKGRGSSGCQASLLKVIECFTPRPGHGEPRSGHGETRS